MKALLYLIRHSFINYLKSLKKKPLKALGPAFMLLFLLLFFVPKKGDGGSADPDMKIVFVIIFAFIMTAFLLYSINKGTKRIKSYFLMSDVNFIFPSPIRPQTVLLYGLVKQIAMELLVSFWFVYQIPNILRSFNVPGKNRLALVAAFLVFQIVFSNCLKLMIFALCAKFKGLAVRIRWAVRFLTVAMVALPAAAIYINRNQPEIIERAGIDFYESSRLGYLPVIGWMKEIAYQGINQINGSFIIYILLFLALSALFIYVTYGVELDYYEDVLSMAEDNELTKKVKTGRVKQGDVDYTKYANKKMKMLVNPLRRVRLKLDGVYGARVIFYRHVNEYLKRGIWFINLYSLIQFGIALLYALTPAKEIKFLLFGFGVLLVYSALGNKLQTDIMSHYIYMIPDEPERKLFYGSISSLIKVGIDSLLLFVPSGIMMGSSALEIILCVATYLSIGVLCTFSGLFVYKIGGKIGLLASPVLFSLFMMLFQSMMLVVNILVVVIIALNLGGLGSYAVYLAMLIVNLAGSVGFIYGCRSMLDNMEQNQWI